MPDARRSDQGCQASVLKPWSGEKMLIDREKILVLPFEKLLTNVDVFLILSRTVGLLDK